jgi:hypothetical protein
MVASVERKRSTDVGESNRLAERHSRNDSIELDWDAADIAGLGKTVVDGEDRERNESRES